MANRMTVEKRNTILRLLVEGNGIRGTARLMRTNIPGVLRQLEWAGTHCQNLRENRLTGLTLRHVECDEIWTFCGKKQDKLTVDEKRERSDIGDAYLWTACDQDSKLIAAHVLGKRSANNARLFMEQLASRLAWPNAHASDSHAYRTGRIDPIIQISTDGFAAYPEAVDQFFGRYAAYGVIVKDYRNASMPYTPSEIVGTQRRAVFGMNDNELSTICTSHVERNNLTIRTFMRRFTRLALGFSKKFANLEAAVNLHVAYFNFCWKPETLGGMTPAEAAGITNHGWSFHELLSAE